ncbi:MAG: 4-hydroxy-tetrahydrodipicolinate synthase [Candidatus Omnitrophica bacterium]|nr:4-hydroxy-tetrahydrodipicolinate synthase [Candidatus Omnitrophota bacterium]
MFTGSIVAIVTPFKDGKFDRESFKNLVEFQISNGTDAIVPVGCTGEAATLTHDEHKEVIDYTLEIVNRRVPVIAGTGSNSTAEALELTRYAKKAGCDGALIITPYYNKPVPEGLYRHYKTIAEDVDIPILLYNVPSRTGISILPETVAKLAEIKNIVGIKEASGSLDQVSKIISLCPEDFVVLSGDDSMTLPIMAVGGKGVISVAANIVPALVKEMVHAALLGNWAEAQKMHIKLFNLFKALFIETNPIPVKGCLYLMGKINLELRMPLTPPSEKTMKELENILKQYRLIS